MNLEVVMRDERYCIVRFRKCIGATPRTFLTIAEMLNAIVGWENANDCAMRYEG
jgi:hypothetical protein